MKALVVKGEKTCSFAFSFIITISLKINTYLTQKKDKTKKKIYAGHIAYLQIAKPAVPSEVGGRRCYAYCAVHSLRDARTV